MIIKFLEREDFINYKKPSMFIGFPYCTFKCDKENGTPVCQNLKLCDQENREVSLETIYNAYVTNDITQSIVCGGLEPLESIDELLELISCFRNKGCNDDFVIYTGYTEEEVRDSEKFSKLLDYHNIVIKFGRFRPNQPHHFDEVLGVELASDNQYAVRYN